MDLPTEEERRAIVKAGLRQYGRAEDIDAAAVARASEGFTGSEIVALITEDPNIEELVWKYTLWYYNQMDCTYVPSRSTGKELVERGVPSAKIRTFPRGIDIERFHPRNVE